MAGGWFFAADGVDEGAIEVGAEDGAGHFEGLAGVGVGDALDGEDGATAGDIEKSALAGGGDAGRNFLDATVEGEAEGVFENAVEAFALEVVALERGAEAAGDLDGFDGEGGGVLHAEAADFVDVLAGGQGEELAGFAAGGEFAKGEDAGAGDAAALEDLLGEGAHFLLLFAEAAIGDEGAAAALGFDEALAFEDGGGLAEGHAADAVSLAEDALGRERIPRGVYAATQERAHALGNLDVNGRRGAAVDFERLEAAGIDVTLCHGFHDCRERGRRENGGTAAAEMSRPIDSTLVPLGRPTVNNPATDMPSTGIVLALFSGLANGLFTAPMKMESLWRWENLWAVFIVTSCLGMPAAFVLAGMGNPGPVLAAAPEGAVRAAVAFGLAWGFGSICFGLSVDKLGVSIANSMVIGLSSALGSLVPLVMRGRLGYGPGYLALYGGIGLFLAGVMLCARAGLERDEPAGAPTMGGYLLATAAGVMSAVFNIGYALALPIAEAGTALGHTLFASTNVIWMLMLAAGSAPNLAYCAYLMRRNGSAELLTAPGAGRSWARAGVMGLLWGGSIFLYGAATPRLGALGPSVGWPLSLAAGLLVANVMGVLLGEWRTAPARATRAMGMSLALLTGAIVLCALSARWRA